MPFFYITPSLLKFFVSLDSGPWGSKTTFSAGCVISDLGHSEKFKMADTGKVL